MRFDDRLSTLLAQPTDSDSAKAAVWAQIADVMTQEADRLPPEQWRAGMERLNQWRELVPEHRRRASAESLSFHRLPADMVDFFAMETPQIAAPVLTRAQLCDADWIRLVPAWPPTSRALLRERRDLSPETRRLLASYGTHDFALPAGAFSESSDVAQIQIRDLVARIEAYRRDHRMPKPPKSGSEIITDFRFESDSDGIVNWVEGAPRAPLIGTSLSDMADPGGYGVDGHAAGAYRQRTLFRDAHLEVAGASGVAGSWLISADPLFNPHDGRFLGYRGIAKRREAAKTHLSPLIGGSLSADSIRQLAHELRTPLNAIRGFGEMIEGQFLGPVARHYNDMARRIVKDATRLMSVIDDLDSASRLDAEAWPADKMTPLATDVGDILDSVASEIRPLSDDLGITLRVSVARQLPLALVSASTCARLTGRLFSAMVQLAARGEVLTARLEHSAGSIALRIDRPKCLAGLSAEQIVASASVDGGSGAGGLALGLGFTMRLIDAMARRVGGYLDIGHERFSLILPCAVDNAGESKESG